MLDREQRRRERVHQLAMMFGTALQRSFLRFSNLVIVLLALGAMVVMPSAFIGPAVVGAVLLVAGNTFLGATDEELLSGLVDDLHGAATVALPEGSTAELAERASRAPLNARARELYQRAARCRKELTRELEQSSDDLLGLDLDDVNARLEKLTMVFRNLAARMTRLEKSLGGRTPEELLEEAKGLLAKAGKADDERAQSEYTRAAEEKQRHAQALRDIAKGQEAIEAKLLHILSSLEAFQARIAALGARGGTALASAANDVDELVDGLTEGAEDLEETLELIDP